MASITPARVLRPACMAARTVARPLAAIAPRRAYSSIPDSAEQEINPGAPRWSYTPPQTQAPFSLRTHSTRPAFHNNSDPALLDQFYIRILGEGGDRVLNEELKWLAVTHKTFDQGRRGFNDRLAALGKRIVQLQASLALVQNPPTEKTASRIDEFGRKPFSHPALEGLGNLSSQTKSFLTDRRKLAELAQKYELQKVMRWSPRKPEDLRASGLELVLSHTLYAVVGAVALEKGGLEANKVAKERILQPLGLQTS
ncbi:hypothetical protein N7495_000973 [Penicillium taxi]|uniref:uncharacterized protein n=1 Tax=Penicillium taxi TaxID=168475 RepID=UPI0025455364|nr:uncharacterized protein N7495_000973 [Penicillium taxi]KAJ5908291.1 hypothetical protein N7495_000973 [Penicillium taxi]